MNDKPIVSFMLLYKSYNRIIRHELLMYTISTFRYEHTGKLDMSHRI